MKNLIRKILKEEIDSDWDFVGDVSDDIKKDLSIESVTHLVHSLGSNCFYINYDDNTSGQIKFNGTMDTFTFINTKGEVMTLRMSQLYSTLMDDNPHMTYEIGKCRG